MTVGWEARMLDLVCARRVLLMSVMAIVVQPDVAKAFATAAPIPRVG